ncbi:hypothetical protein MRX96_053086 [Rhipicephalus microplus]
MVWVKGRCRTPQACFATSLLAESLKTWVPCDDSSSNDSSSDDSSSEDSWSDDSSTDDGADLAHAVSGAGVEVDDDTGSPCKRRRLDDFPGEWRGDTGDLNTLEPRPGPSGFQDDSTEEDDGDVWPVRGAPLAIWLNVLRGI